jgi:hypothetical protein
LLVGKSKGKRELGRHDVVERITILLKFILKM